MQKLAIILFIFLIPVNLNADISYYKNLKTIKIDIFRNNKLIGYNNYFFKKNKDLFEVENEIKFKVALLGADVFKLFGRGKEKYLNNKLISFKSQTIQNKKNKYVNLNYDKNKDLFIIDGSSFKGTVSIDSVVGNWWNHELLKTEKQISPVSGSIKEQIVTFLGKEKIKLYGKEYLADHFKIQSKNLNTPKNKKLNFDVWVDKKSLMILKVSYSKFGEWEYRLKSYN